MSILDRTAFLDQIRKDLQKKMVFIGGPRQVGKTTLAQQLLHNYREGHPGYLNWDNPEHRRKILNGEWPREQKLIIFDEVHKFKNWRNLIKGYYDTFKKNHQFLVTGSARLDLYRKGGDSLLGRYYYHRLHPFHVDELPTNVAAKLFQFGGFPEPYLTKDPTELKRWHLQRRERVIYSDVRDFDSIKDISMMDLLVEALPVRVGSPLSRKALSEDIQVDQKTVERWLQILERVYYIFRLSPFGAPRIKAVKKEQKMYLWDWSENDNLGKRWENFIASLLLKYCHTLEDRRGDKMELRYLRDQTGRETDFVVTRNRRPLFAVEAKLSDRIPDPTLRYFSERTNIPIFIQVFREGSGISLTEKVSSMPLSEFARFLNNVEQ